MEIVIMILGAAAIGLALVRSGGGTTSWLAGEDDGWEGWQSIFGDEIVVGIRPDDDLFSDDDLLNINDDYYYSMVYSHLPCNVHYDSSSDFMSSSSSVFDDDDICGCSTDPFDDDICGCTSSIGIDDDMCGCSSFDDDGIGIGCGWDD